MLHGVSKAHKMSPSGLGEQNIVKYGFSSAIIYQN